jgi:protein-tyrosine phosphatase
MKGRYRNAGQAYQGDNGFRSLTGYKSLPVLDATAPTEEQLRSMVGWLTVTMDFGPIYIHCALGHGRSACVVIAYMLSIGKVGTVAEGVRLLQSLRRGVRLNSAQRQRLRLFEMHQDSQDNSSTVV